MGEFITEEGKEILAKYDSVIAELVKILTPHIKKAVVAELRGEDESLVHLIQSEVSEAFEKYDLDTAITGIIDDYNFDSVIETRCDELGLMNEDGVKELIEDHNSDNDFESYKFRDAVKDVVRDMDFKIEVN